MCERVDALDYEFSRVVLEKDESTNILRSRCGPDYDCYINQDVEKDIKKRMEVEQIFK